MKQTKPCRSIYLHLSIKLQLKKTGKLTFLKNLYSLFIEKHPRKTVFILMFTFLCYFYSPILFHPSSYIFGDMGDGIKNYFCYQWHIQNDTSFINYTGTNYPFGEHHTFTDGTPLLSNFVKALPFLKSHSIAIFNLSLLFSIILTALLLFNIFKEFFVANIFSIISAIGITILSPQMLRLQGHYSLSFSFFIPLLIYLLLLFETRENKTKYTFLICLTILCAFFIHPYIGMILTTFAFLYHLLKICLHVKKLKQLLLPFFTQSIFPVLFYFLFLKFTDTHTDRITHPYGFLFYTANIETVFVSTMKPFRHMLSQLIKIKIQNFEGIAYVGISSLFALLYLPFLLFSKRTKLKEIVKNNKILGVFLFMTLASIPILFFSMGYPFKWNAEWILDEFPLIKQFRSPGRFAWVFYYITTIAAVIIISKYFLTKANPIIKYVTITAILLLFIVEGIPYHRQITEHSFPKNYFDSTNIDGEMKEICMAMKKTKAQAIIPLPFFHIETDYFYFTGTEKIKTTSFIIANNTNIPIAASSTPRTSLSEAKCLIQLVGSSLIKKDLEKYVKQTEPFYILYSKETLDEGEQNLLAKGQVVLETKNYLLKIISTEELFANDAEKYLSYYSQNKNQLKFTAGFYLADSSFIKYVTFDNLPGKQLTASIYNECVLLDIQPNSLEKDKVYEVSFWYNLKSGDELGEDIQAREMDDANNTIRLLSEKRCNQMPDVVKDKVLIKLNFKTSNPQNKIRICQKGNIDYKYDTFTLDNLLVRRKDVDVYRMIYSPEIKDSVLTVNNFELLK